MKSLGYVLGEFPVLSETFVGTEMRALIKQGYAVQPFTFCFNTQKGQPIDSDLAQKTKTFTDVPLSKSLYMWLRNPGKSAKALQFIFRQNGLPKLSLIRTAGQLAWQALQTDCHHLHAHFALHTKATAIAAAKLGGQSVSFVGHGFDIYVDPKDLPLKIQSSDFAVAVCRDMKSEFMSLASNSKVHHIDCGIDPKRYPFKPQAYHNGRLLFIGRLTEKKGLEDIFQALALIEGYDRPVLDIVGEGPLKASLEAYAKELNIERAISFLGAQPSEWIIKNAANYAALCSPFCEASNGDKDTGPLVVKEAMALGLPVVCSYFMGCKDILSKKTGLFVPPKAPKAIANAIKQVFSFSTSERLNLTTRARKRVENRFSADISGLKLAMAIQGAK